MKLRDLYQKLDSGERSRLAARAGISGVYLWQLQSGVRKNPTSEVLRRLAAADRRLTVADMLKEFSSPVAASDREQITTPTYTGPDRRRKVA